MPDTESLRNQLMRFGLSPKQADIYLLLLRGGNLRVRDITTRLHIPRSSVYEHLKVLTGLSLIEEIIDGTYHKIRAYPFSSIRHRIEEQIAESQELLGAVESMEQELQALTLGAGLQQTAVRYYQGKAGARQLIWNSLKAKETVYVYSAWGRGSFVGMKYYEHFVSESKARYIKEQVLINPLPATLDSIYRYLGAPTSRTRLDDIRAIPRSDVAVIGETFIYDSIYAQVYLQGDEMVGFEIENTLFSSTQRSIFETLWKQATPLSDLRS